MTPEQLDKRLKVIEQFLGDFKRPDRYVFTKDIELANNRKVKGWFYPGILDDGGVASVLPDGWSVFYIGGNPGVYEVTHNLGTTNYIVFAQPVPNGGFNADRAATITTYSATQFIVNVNNTAGAGTNCPIFFALFRV